MPEKFSTKTKSRREKTDGPKAARFFICKLKTRKSAFENPLDYLPLSEFPDSSPVFLSFHFCADG
jgi:hypothetical protein